MTDPVADFYDQNLENEWNRLFRSPYRRIEYEVALHFLDRYLPPQGHVLDLGGGPGRYALALARKGYCISLVDLSPANVRWARDKIERAGLGKMLIHDAAGDARDLDGLADDAFDAVLCMGPLYHLIRPEDRLRCLLECRRVLKPGGPLFVTAIPRTSYLRDDLRSGRLAETLQKTPAVVDEILTHGHSSSAPVPDMYFCRIEEIAEWFKDARFDLLQTVNLHGLAAFLDDQVNALGRDAAAWNKFLGLVLDTCTDPAALSSAEHLLAVGRKPV